MINNFKNKFCINLDRRPDKWKECEDEFKKNNIENVVRWIATDGNPDNLPNKMTREPITGNLGCTISHLRLLKHAKENSLSEIVVFEDDVAFMNNFNDKFNDFIKQIPNDWDMIYFCGNNQGGFKMINNNVAKVFGTYTTHSYIMKNSVYDLYINILSNLEDVVDVLYASQHKNLNVYIFRPHLTYQRAGISDIQGGFVDYSFLKN
jgi:GR25 family glycosyltransferase involved in LPS biosynthesis